VQTTSAEFLQYFISKLTHLTKVSLQEIKDNVVDWLMLLTLGRLVGDDDPRSYITEPSSKCQYSEFSAAGERIVMSTPAKI